MKRIITLLIAVIFLLSLGKVVFGVTGDSMNPILYSGDIVITWPAETYKPGDIVIFTRTGENHQVLHRIKKNYINIEGRPFYITKGDNNHYIDGKFIYSDEISGKVLIVISMSQLWKGISWQNTPGN